MVYCKARFQVSLNISNSGHQRVEDVKGILLRESVEHKQRAVSRVSLCKRDFGVLSVQAGHDIRHTTVARGAISLSTWTGLTTNPY